MILLYAILGLGLNIVVGYAGLLDLGYVAFYAIGAYTYALLASGQFDIHLPFALVLLIGAGLAGFAGILLGIPVLRLRGDYLAIVTLGFGEIIRVLMNNLDVADQRPAGHRPHRRSQSVRLDARDAAGLPLSARRHAGHRLPVRLAGAGERARHRARRGARGPGRRARLRHRHHQGEARRLRLQRGHRRRRRRDLRGDAALRQPGELHLLGVAGHRAGHRRRRPRQSVRRAARGDAADPHPRAAARLCRLPAAALRHGPGDDHPRPAARPHQPRFRPELAGPQARGR